MLDNLLKHSYICGIGGIGMSGVAHLLLDLGMPVMGSDLRRSVLTRDLEERGAVIGYAPNPALVREASCVIAPSSFPALHPELVVAREYGVERLTRSRALAYLCKSAGCVPILCFGTTARGKLARLGSGLPEFGWCAGAAIADVSAPRHAVLGRNMMLDIDEREFLANPEAFADFRGSDVIVSDWQNDELGYYGSDARFLPENFVHAAQTFLCTPASFLVMPENNASVTQYSLWQDNRIIERFAFNCDFERGVIQAPKNLGMEEVHFCGTRFDASAVAAAQVWRWARNLSGIQRDLECVGWFNRIAPKQFHDIRMHPVNVRNAIASIRAFAGKEPVQVAIKPFASTLKWYEPERWQLAFDGVDSVYVISPPYEGCCEQDCLEFAQNLRNVCRNVEVISLENAHALVDNHAFWLWIGADDLL